MRLRLIGRKQYEVYGVISSQGAGRLDALNAPVTRSNIPAESTADDGTVIPERLGPHSLC
jgi:hypothetical protein